jgi:hypothetical protein
MIPCRLPLREYTDVRGLDLLQHDRESSRAVHARVLSRESALTFTERRCRTSTTLRSGDLLTRLRLRAWAGVERVDITVGGASVWSLAAASLSPAQRAHDVVELAFADDAPSDPWQAWTELAAVADVVAPVVGDDCSAVVVACLTGRSRSLHEAVEDTEADTGAATRGEWMPCPRGVSVVWDDVSTRVRPAEEPGPLAVLGAIPLFALAFHEVRVVVHPRDADLLVDAQYMVLGTSALRNAVCSRTVMFRFMGVTMHCGSGLSCRCRCEGGHGARHTSAVASPRVL